MEDMKENIHDRLWTVFWEEAGQKLDEMRRALNVLGQDSSSCQDACGVLYRGAHTLKGNAGAMGLKPIAALAGRVERVATILSAAGKVSNDGIMALLIEAVEVLGSSTTDGVFGPTEDCEDVTAALDERLRRYAG